MMLGKHGQHIVYAGGEYWGHKEATMTSRHQGGFARHWKEIASGFLKLGLTAYGGPAIMGLMQAELQEKRQWIPKERFVEGLSLVNMLPGAGATQLGIFLGHARGGGAVGCWQACASCCPPLASCSRSP